MTPSSFSFEGEHFKHLGGSSYVNRARTHVIKLLSKPPDIRRYYELARLIPQCMLMRIKSVTLTISNSKRFGVMMPYIRCLKPACSFMPDDERLSLYLQIIDTLMAALPSFDFHTECRLASVFWRRKDGKLVVLNPMRLFRTQRGSFTERLARVGRVLEKVDCVIAQSPGDAIFELVLAIKQSIRFHQPSEQMTMIQNLADTVQQELSLCRKNAWWLDDYA